MSPNDDFDPHLEACFPVIFDSKQGEKAGAIQWEPIQMKMIKESKHACASCGPTAPYTLQLLEILAARWMKPYDWKAVAKACLSGGQFILWRTEYEDLAQKQADSNLTYGPRYIVKNMLIGIMNMPYFQN